MTKPPMMILWLEKLLPASLRDAHPANSEALMRARAMVAILAISITMPLVVLVNYLILQITTDSNFDRNIYILIGVEVWLVAQLLYFQSYGNLRLTAGIYSVQFLLAAVATIMISGSWTSPFLVLLAASPMIAFMTIGYRAALWHVALALFIVTGLLTLHHFQITLVPNLSRPGHAPYNQFIAWDIVLLVFAAFLVILEHLLRGQR